MGWFELNAENLGYRNLMGVSRSREELLEGISSFADVSWWVYALSLIAITGFGVFLFLRSSLLDDKLASYCRVAIVLSVVLCIYGGYLCLLLWNVPFAEFSEKVREGVFGDSLGTLNALFSGLAFSGILITLLFQRKDLSETRAQIANQQAESQFYSMLAQQQEVVRGLDIQHRKTNEVVSRGRDCFREWAETLVNMHAGITSSSSSSSNEDDGDEGSSEHERKIFARAISSMASFNEPHSAAYSFVFELYRADLSLYFRSLYSIFRFIENSDHKDSGKFGLVVRSLLSDYELMFIFYNCLSGRGEKFKRFVYNFALFDNLDPDLLLEPEHALYLDIQAFGQNEAILRLFPDPLGPPEREGC